MNEGHKNNTLTDLKRIWHKSEPAEFIFKQGLPYIWLTEEKNDQEALFLDYAYQALPAKNHSFLLDADLAVIAQAPAKTDFSKQLQQIAAHEQQEYPLSFLHRRFELPALALAPIPYLKFPELHDFHFGRAGFGRATQSYKIQSDSISKDHCTIAHFKTDNSKQFAKFKILKAKLLQHTPLSSGVRKVSEQLWENIFHYAGLKTRYVVTDLGSRNGTWLSRVLETKVPIRQNLEYQFEGQNYTIHISKTYTSKDSAEETALEHNMKVAKLLEEFKKEVNWCYYEPAKKMILLGPGEEAGHIGSKCTHKVQAVVLKIKYREYHEFYFLGITEASLKAFPIGSKQEIDVSAEEDDFPSLHGLVTLRKGSWVLEVSMQDRKIWTKIPKGYPYAVDPKHCYKMRLGYAATFELDFCNF